MTRSTTFFCILFSALTACGDNLTPETPGDAGPPDAPQPPDVDGEYTIDVLPVSLMCYGEPRPTEEIFALANIVEQDNPWQFDLRSNLSNSFMGYYDRPNIPFAADGYFKDERVDDVSIGGFIIQAKRFVEGSANPDGTLSFSLSNDFGLNGAWTSFCLYEADVFGEKRYTSWNKKPRATIDGQWRVKKTILESPLFYPTTLPYTHFTTMDTITQNEEGAYFNIFETFKPLWSVERNPITGKVDASIFVFVHENQNGENRVRLYETYLRGTLLPDYMRLEFTWIWSITETDGTTTEQWRQRELYEGVPRYNPRNPALPEPPQGAYNAEYTLLPGSDCGDTPYTEHNVLDVRPIDGGFWPKITTYEIEPVVHLDSNGKLTEPMVFNLNFDGGSYAYKVDGAITGHAVDLTMDINVLDYTTMKECKVKFKIAGQKRYESYR